MNCGFKKINDFKHTINLEDIHAYKNKSADSWGQFIRENEALIALGHLSKMYNFKKFERVLELGCGEGFQAKLLSKHCEELIATDINPELIQKNKERWRGYCNIKWEIVDSENLSMFDDGYFDVLFSSNMIAHVANKDKCIKEMQRVISKDGMIVVSVPSRIWRLAAALVFYFEEARLILKKQKFKVHRINTLGCYRNIREEFIAFSKKKWVVLFEKEGLRVVKIIRFPFYHGYRNHYLWLLKVGNHLHLSSSYCFFFQKIDNIYTKKDYQNENLLYNA